MYIACTRVYRCAHIIFLWVRNRNIIYLSYCNYIVTIFALDVITKQFYIEICKYKFILIYTCFIMKNKRLLVFINIVGNILHYK